MNLLKKIARRILYTDPISKARKLGVKIGDNCRLLDNVRFHSEPYLITIGNHVSITDSEFITHDGAVWIFREEMPEIDSFGRINVGDNIFIGSKCLILPGVSIGNNTIVGAGSVVTKDLEGGFVYAGVPAKRICTIDEYRDKNEPRFIMTKNMSSSQKKKFLLRNSI